MTGGGAIPMVQLPAFNADKPGRKIGGRRTGSSQPPAVAAPRAGLIYLCAGARGAPNPHAGESTMAYQGKEVRPAQSVFGSR